MNPLSSFTQLQQEQLREFLRPKETIVQMEGRLESAKAQLRSMGETSGGAWRVVKPEVDMTTLTLGTGTTVSFNSALEPGEFLEDLDFLVNILTSTRDKLRKSYNESQDGDNGPVVPRNSDLGRKTMEA